MVGYPLKRPVMKETWTEKYHRAKFEVSPDAEMLTKKSVRLPLERATFAAFLESLSGLKPELIFIDFILIV